jgi:hypothetical protein
LFKGVFQNNQHLSIMDGHGSHIIIQAPKQVAKLGVDMVTLSTHILHVLHPLDVTYFKPFNIDFRKKLKNVMATYNYLELDKVTQTTWVDKAL